MYNISFKNTKGSAVSLLVDVVHMPKDSVEDHVWLVSCIFLGQSCELFNESFQLMISSNFARFLCSILYLVRHLKLQRWTVELWSPHAKLEAHGLLHILQWWWNSGSQSMVLPHISSNCWNSSIRSASEDANDWVIELVWQQVRSISEWIVEGLVDCTDPVMKEYADKHTTIEELPSTQSTHDHQPLEYFMDGHRDADIRTNRRSLEFVEWVEDCESILWTISRLNITSTTHVKRMTKVRF